jgi:hypothetical protein
MYGFSPCLFSELKQVFVYFELLLLFCCLVSFIFFVLRCWCLMLLVFMFLGTATLSCLLIFVVLTFLCCAYE